MNFLIIRAKIARIHQNTKQTPYFLTSSYRFCITPLPIPVSFSSCRIDAPFFLKSASVFSCSALVSPKNSIILAVLVMSYSITNTCSSLGRRISSVSGPMHAAPLGTGVDSIRTISSWDSC